MDGTEEEEGENSAAPDMEGNTGGNITAPDMEENTTEGQRSMRNKIRRRGKQDGGFKKRPTKQPRKYQS